MGRMARCEDGAGGGGDVVEGQQQRALPGRLVSIHSAFSLSLLSSDAVTLGRSAHTHSYSYSQAHTPYSDRTHDPASHHERDAIPGRSLPRARRSAETIGSHSSRSNSSSNSSSINYQ